MNIKKLKKGEVHRQKGVKSDNIEIETVEAQSSVVFH
jgi:hypothetical protein